MSEENVDNGSNAADAVAEMAGDNGGTAPVENSPDVATRPENCPEKFWDTEKNEIRHDDVLKSYSELSSKFGAFTGAPDDYVAAISDELKEQGVELVEDDPMIEEAMKFAKESGMNQEGFSKMINLYAMNELAKKTAQNDAVAADIASLGDNADRRLNNLSQWASKNLSEDMQEGFKDLAVGADAVLALEQIVSMTRSAPVQVAEASTGPSITKEEVNKMQFETDEHGNRLIQISPEHKARYEKARDLLHGTEPFNQMVG